MTAGAGIRSGEKYNTSRRSGGHYSIAPRAGATHRRSVEGKVSVNYLDDVEEAVVAIEIEQRIATRSVAGLANLAENDDVIALFLL